MKWLNGYRIKLVLCGFMAAIVVSGGSAKADSIWTWKAGMPTPRWGHTSAVVDGKIYVIGGGASEPDNWMSEWGELLSTVEEYYPATNTWTTKADMPIARGWMSPSSAVVDGKIYVIGGDAGEDVDDMCLPTVEEYDPATDTWTRKADMPTGRDCLATVAVDGKIYAIGGALPNVNAGLKTVEMYDPATDTWTRKADMPRSVWLLNTSVVRGKIYALGGRPGNKAVSWVQEYDPATDTWTLKGDMPLGTSNMGSVVLDDKIVVIGGWLWSMNNPYTAVQVYDPETDIWTREADVPFLRAVFSAEVVDNRIYAIGGTDKSHPCLATSTVYEFGPLLDFNGDGILDAGDMCIMVDHWGENYPLCDIGPTPLGDGIVDVQDLIVLAEHLFEEPGLIANWKLDEEAGDTAHNSVGEYHGTLHGKPIWQPEGGILDGALEFDGSDDYVGAPFILNPKEVSFSVTAWIWGGAPGQVIISQADANGESPLESGSTWLGINPSDGRLMTGLMDIFFGPLESESVVTDGQWYHVGLVYDRTIFKRHLYVDGAEVAVDAGIVGGVQSTSGLYIGAGQTLDGATFFSGLIDDVRIYNRAVTP